MVASDATERRTSARSTADFFAFSAAERAEASSTIRASRSDIWRSDERATAGTGVAGAAAGADAPAAWLACGVVGRPGVVTTVWVGLPIRVVMTTDMTTPPRKAPTMNPNPIRTEARRKTTPMMSRVPQPGQRGVPSESGRAHLGQLKTCASGSPMWPAFGAFDLPGEGRHLRKLRVIAGSVARTPAGGTRPDGPSRGRTFGVVALGPRYWERASRTQPAG